MTSRGIPVRRYTDSPAMLPHVMMLLPEAEMETEVALMAGT